MIHVNKGNGKHEFMTEAEFEAQYGKKPSSQGPFFDKVKDLSCERIDKAIGIRELASRLGWKVGYLSDFEHGRVEPTQSMINSYRTALATFPHRG